MRFLIDECLTVDLVAVAGDCGQYARHVVHVGRAGWKDWNVLRYANDGDFVLVTNKASDFRQLYATEPLAELIRLAAENGIAIELLIDEALDSAGVETG